MERTRTELDIEVINNKDTLVCKECKGTFWSQTAFNLHWSCNKKTRCSCCFQFGHTIGRCPNRNNFVIKPIPIKEFLEMRWQNYD